jgi:hypothetical protein
MKSSMHAWPTDPAHIVTVKDFSHETISRLVAHLEVSTDFEHLVYREAELDALWSITGFLAVHEPESDQRETAARLHAGAERAHDLVAERRPTDAARVLRGFL